jgi:hypothetical protein
MHDTFQLLPSLSSKTRVLTADSFLSVQYPFLAHAVLGFAAQNLTVSSTADHSVAALNHRVQAITAMNEALSAPNPSPSDCDARLAATILLTFQSGCMPDAMMEFVRVLRGWMIIQTTIVPDRERSLFRGFTEDAYVASMGDLLEQDSPAATTCDGARKELRDLLDNFEASLHTVASLCRTPIEHRYVSSMRGISLTARSSPTDGKSLLRAP